MYDDISIISNASKIQHRNIHVFFSFDRLKFRVELMSEFHLVVIVSPRQEVGSINRRRETTGPPSPPLLVDGGSKYIDAPCSSIA